jgi:hypothetical protein
MGTATVLLLAVSGVLDPFLPNVRVDHQNLPGHHMYAAELAVGTGHTVYVVFEDDSFVGLDPVRIDVVFQKSTDAGTTWLSKDKIVHRGETYAQHPDVTTGSDGNIYLAYMEWSGMYDGHIYCVRSTDGGTIWSPPAKVDDNEDAVPVGLARLAEGADGVLFCAWDDSRTGESHIWSSRSTDHGTTWSPSVRVCDDTTFTSGCNISDVFIQPGANHYLVAATAPYRVRPGYNSQHACLYCSIDMGLTFQPGVTLDTLVYASTTHVVADSQHIICDYTGEGEGEYNITQARTLYTPPDTWGSRSFMNDTTYNSYYSGELALSADGRVHAALMMNWLNGYYDMCYVFSTDHGASWSSHVRMNDDTTSGKAYPGIAVDSAGHVYAAWDDGRDNRDEIWFSTNCPLAVEERPKSQTSRFKPGATIVHGVLLLPEASSLQPQAASWLLDISGRKVMALKPGANDVSRLSPGVYFVRQASGVKREASSVCKVVIAR